MLIVSSDRSCRHAAASERNSWLPRAAAVCRYQLRESSVATAIKHKPEGLKPPLAGLCFIAVATVARLS